MSISPISNRLAGIKAYQEALKTERTQAGANQAGASKAAKGFGEVVTDSLKSVNDLQIQKDSMVKSFASGEQENVHDLMISLQKAGIAMSMTATVRNKVMEAYKEIMRTQF